MKARSAGSGMRAAKQYTVFRSSAKGLTYWFCNECGSTVTYKFCPRCAWASRK